ncbi:MAG TPA: 5-(carboxyamino)imidazole ribonucleotide mutase [Proteobacteria bacterium]|nr:N5-carboxyaminoimidazole ribonucleotide mutase [bacterium BMS3Abin14]HDL54187.1 5-(carboxyamino)imidazole ribonucleotide mutase [Pseudomonadota bacterium]
MGKFDVLIMMGSASDRELMTNAALILTEFGVPHRIEVASAHRSPERVRRLVKEADEAECSVFIAGAGKAAHLAGVVASHTIKPVIGVPIPCSPLQGMDALLSTVQMPAGIPVATMAIGSTGAQNAALLAVSILALSDDSLAQKLAKNRLDMAQAFEE